MKKTCKFIGIIALTAVIVFAMAACSNSANGGGSSGDTTSGGGTFTIGSTFRFSGEMLKDEDYYKAYEDPSDTEANLNFGYLDFYDEDTDTYLLPLGDLFTGTPKAEITDGKLTIALDQPKPASMDLMKDAFMPGITVTPNDAKMFLLEYFFTEDEYHILFLRGGENVDVCLVYVNKNVKINGTFSEWGGVIYLITFP